MKNWNNELEDMLSSYLNRNLSNQIYHGVVHKVSSVVDINLWQKLYGLEIDTILMKKYEELE